jgi:hypothetical protein
MEIEATEEAIRFLKNQPIRSAVASAKLWHLDAWPSLAGVWQPRTKA